MKRTARAREALYEKVSATLERPVLRQIRKLTPNVSGFLNDAAKAKLYFERLREMDEELARQGVELDEAFYRALKERTSEIERRQRRPARRTR